MSHLRAFRMDLSVPMIVSLLALVVNLSASPASAEVKRKAPPRRAAKAKPTPTKVPTSMPSAAEQAFVRCLKLPSRRRIKVDLKPNSTVQDLVGWIATMTCQNFIVPAGLGSQRVTLLSPHPITPREAYRAFTGALGAIGLALVPAGRKSWRVSRGDAASRGALPTFVRGQGRHLPRGAQVVTQLWRPRWARAQDLLPVLMQLKDRSAAVQLYAPGNTLIITSPANTLRRMLSIARALDSRPQGRSFYLLRPRVADAAEVQKLLESVFGDKAKGKRSVTRARARTTRRGRKREAARASSQTSAAPADAPQFFSDAASNTLVVLATKEGYQRIAALVDAVDVEGKGAKSRPWVYRLRHADADKLAKVLTPLLSGATSARRGRRGRSAARSPVAAFEGQVKVQADKESNALVILATARDYLGLRPMIAELDRPRRQVFVQAHIIETNTLATRELGIALHGGSVSGSTTIIGGQQFAGLQSLVLDSSTLASLGGLNFAVQGEGIPGTADLFGLNQNLGAFGMILKALATNSDVDFLSSPHLLTLDNQPAEVVVGDSIPIRSGVTSTAAAATSADPTLLASLVQPVTRQEVGVKLKVTPTIGERDELRLKVEQEVSEVAKEDFGGGLGASIAKRTIKTVVALQNGQTVVIGGLVKKRISIAESKVPFLGDIPILGALFRTRQKKRERVNLLVILTPHVIRDRSDLRRIFKRKMGERHALLRAFGKDGRANLSQLTDLDFNYKRGLLAEIDRVGAAVEKKVALRDAADQDSAQGPRDLGRLDGRDSAGGGLRRPESGPAPRASRPPGR